MKTPKSSSEKHSEQMISILNKFDLNELTISVSKLKEYRKLMVDGDYTGADTLYISTVSSALHKSDLKAFRGDIERYALKRGGISRSKQKTEEANEIKSWLYPLLAECDATIPSERKQRGWSTLQRMAKRELTLREEIERQTKTNYIDPKIKFITRSRIQTWIDEGRPKNPPS